MTDGESVFPFPKLGRVPPRRQERPMPCRALTKDQLRAYVAKLQE